MLNHYLIYCGPSIPDTYNREPGYIAQWIYSTLFESTYLKIVHLSSFIYLYCTVLSTYCLQGPGFRLPFFYNLNLDLLFREALTVRKML